MLLAPGSVRGMYLVTRGLYLDLDHRKLSQPFAHLKRSHKTPFPLKLLKLSELN